jgi:hypothetical protein
MKIKWVLLFQIIFISLPISISAIAQKQEPSPSPSKDTEDSKKDQPNGSTDNATAGHSSQGKEKSEPTKSPKEPANQHSLAGGNPFKKLKVVIPKNKLPSLCSVRVRDKQEVNDRSRTGTISIMINSFPKGADVYYGGKLLGTTPFSLNAQRGSTPYDVIIRHKGYMSLHARIIRKTSKNYFFKLSPAKLR